MRVGFRLVSGVLTMALFGASPAGFGQDAGLTEQVRSLASSVDRLTSSNMEIMRRLERIESRTQAIGGIRQALDSVTTTQMALLQQMQQLRNTVAASAAKPATAAAKPAGPKLPLNMDIGPGRMEGDGNTTVVLVMYGDFQCSFCGRFFEQTLPAIRSEFIDTKKIRFAMRDFTLETHKDANRGAVAARCGEEQGKYWEMTASLHGHQNDLTTHSIEEQAKHVGLDMEAFSACFNSDKHFNDAKMDMGKATALAISGTPSFAIGFTNPGSSQITVTKLLVGSKPIEQFRTALNDSLLNPVPAAQP